MQNVEFKAELRDIVLARSIAPSVGADLAVRMSQVDTYYRMPEGRLKKRETVALPDRGGAGEGGQRVPDETEYIFYERPDESAAKLSRFTIYTPAQAMERFGAAPMPVWAVVKKVRELYLVRRGAIPGVNCEAIRVHLDSVELLGSFIEFEALVTPDRGVEQSRRAVSHLRGAFGPVLGEPIGCSYCDLIIGR